MNDILLVAELFLLVAALFGFIYGAVKNFRKKGVLFLQIVTCALGCMGLGLVFNLVSLLAVGAYPEGLHIGLFGAAGCYFFLLSASYGQIDGLGDDKSASYTKYRVTALAAPALLACLFLLLLLSPAPPQSKTAGGLVMLPMAGASYFNCKHLFLPDVELGILRAIGKYNLLALLMIVFEAACIVCRAYDLTVCTCLARIGSIASTALLMPVAQRGVKQWFI